MVVFSRKNMYGFDYLPAVGGDVGIDVSKIIIIFMMIVIGQNRIRQIIVCQGCFSSQNSVVSTQFRTLTIVSNPILLSIILSINFISTQYFIQTTTTRMCLFWIIQKLI